MRHMFGIFIVAIAAVLAFAASTEPVPWAYAIPARRARRGSAHLRARYQH